jgi:lycopene cyclase domain-containing protein
MSRYLLINLLTVLFPVILSFEKKISFYKKFKYLLFSILTVSPFYLVWDAVATSRGDWGFSPEYLIGIYIFGLPLEEVLFFVTVPYSCIFIYETVKLYIPEKKLPFDKNYYYLAGAILIAVAGFFSSQYYTSTVMVFSAIFLFLAATFKPAILASRVYWISIGITFVPFLVVNYFLTAPPIVWYSPEAIWGARFITIPLEDFFYSFSMISFWFFFYLLYKRDI